MSGTGAITGHIDLAQLTLYVFWLFFAGLIFYLRREDKREGYPMVSPIDGRPSTGFPPLPKPKVFRLSNGEVVYAPRVEAPAEPVNAVKTGSWPGAPMVPLGDPLVDGVGPAAWVKRHDVPDLTLEGHAKIVPLRTDPEYSIAEGDPDPRGMSVVAADHQTVGTVTDVWVDRMEVLARYLEVEIQGPTGARRILVPMTLSKVNAKTGVVTVTSILAAQFASVPSTRSPEQITLREEDQISAYFGGGHLYATKFRRGPLI